MRRILGAWLFLLPFGAGCDIERPLRVVDAPRTVLQLRVAPDTLRLAVGDSARLRVTALGRGDREIGEASVVWGVGNPAVVQLLRPGVVRAVALGQSEVLVASGGLVATALVEVR